MSAIAMPSILVRGMPAPARRYSHEPMTTAASAATTMTRSRVNMLSKVLGDNALRRLRDGGERAVAALGVELDRTCALDVGGCNLGAAVLKALRHHDLDAVRRAGHRVLDRLDVGDEYPRYLQLRLAAVLVEGPVDLREHRVVRLRHDQ